MGKNSRSAGAWAAAQPVTLKPLSLAPDAPKVGVASTVGINGATIGSTITIQSGALPSGLTLDSANRKISGTPAVAGTYSFTLRETLGGATGSPKDTAQTLVVGVVVAAPAGVDTQDQWGKTKGIAPNTVNAAAGNIATRIIGGRMETVTTIASTTTFELLLGLAAPFDAVRLILANGYDATATEPTTFYAAAGVASTDQTAIGASTNWAVSGSGALSKAASVQRRKITFSPWLRTTSQAPVNGAYLVALRAFCATGTIVSLGAVAGADSFTNWITHPSGRIFRMRQQTVDGVTGSNQPNFVSTIDRNSSPIIGVQYMSRGKVFSLAGFGDSITEGRGTYLNEGWGQPAAIQLSTDYGIPFEWSDLGWSGVAYTRISEHVVDAVADGLRFDAAFLPVASPNGLSATITDAEIASNRAYMAVARAALAGANIPAIPWTVLPVNPAVKDFGATDSKRTAYNAEWRALVSKGVVLADFDSKLAGVTDGDGQVNLLVGSTTDGIHPSDVGNALITPIAVNAGKRILAPEAGYLVTA